ncbi:MAG: TIGR02302 family protein [Alphaproteobacteria bacterium]
MRRRRDPVEALKAALGRRLLLAKAVLLWESLWPALWPATGVAGLFVAVSLLDAWAYLPGWAHLAGLCLFGLAFAAGLVRGSRQLRLPNEAAARRRLEQASGLPHRPLAALADRPAGDPAHPAALGLWRLHLERTVATARRLKVGVPAPGLPRKDPLALRAAVLMLVVLGMAMSGPDMGVRLARALAPDLASLGPAAPSELTLWVTPPEYTGVAPLLLDPKAPTTEAVRIPEGSTVLAQVRGGRGAPELLLDEKATPFSRLDEGGYQVTATIAQAQGIAVVQDGKELAAWPIAVIPDLPPAVAFNGPPAVTRRGALRLDYVARDDYGLAAVRAVVHRPKSSGKPLVLDVLLPRPGAGSAKQASFHDLTAHPWAGLSVTIRLVATDGIGQEGRSEAETTVLPQRVFTHPVARAIIEQRRLLATDPSKRGPVAAALSVLSQAPETFADDVTVYLALRAARGRLLYDRTPGAIDEVQQLLWDTALAIEEGPIALAETALREAQRALLEALAREAPDEEIERLLSALEEALDAFLEALVDETLRQPDIRALSEEDMLRLLRADDLKRLIEEARELIRGGARDAAQQLLAELQQILENLRAGGLAELLRSVGSQAEEVLNALRDLIERQQGLLDEAFRHAQGQGKPSDLPLAAAAQEDLRLALRSLIQRLQASGFEVPRGLSGAEEPMGQAAEALAQGQPRLALRPQTEALDRLQQGAQAMVNALLERLGRGALRDNLGFFGVPRDPLGRALYDGGLDDDGSVRVPDKASLQRSREILEELYRRASDPRRPPLEREYLERLLRRF